MLKRRLDALEKVLLSKDISGVAALTDIELDAEIAAVLAQLEEMLPCAGPLNEQLVEALRELLQRGAFPIGAFDEQRVDRLVRHLQMQEENR